METMTVQDYANSLSSALRAYEFQRTEFLGYLLALRSNGLEVTAERIQPYVDAMNLGIEMVWNTLKAMARRRLIETPGAMPKAAYDPARQCDGRCHGAKYTLSTCECACGSALHGCGATFARHYGFDEMFKKMRQSAGTTLLNVEG